VSPGTTKSSEPILPRSGGSGGVKANDMRTGRQSAADGTTVLLDVAEESFDTVSEQIMDVDEREVSSPSHPLEKLQQKGVAGDNGSHPLAREPSVHLHATLDRQDLGMGVEFSGESTPPTPPPAHGEDRLQPQLPRSSGPYGGLEEAYSRDLFRVSRQRNPNVSGSQPESVGIQPPLQILDLSPGINSGWIPAY
jgi:hypothetical protein